MAQIPIPRQRQGPFAAPSPPLALLAAFQHAQRGGVEQRGRSWLLSSQLGLVKLDGSCGHYGRSGLALLLAGFGAGRPQWSRSSG